MKWGGEDDLSGRVLFADMAVCYDPRSKSWHSPPDVVKWLNRDPVRSLPGCCLECGDRDNPHDPRRVMVPNQRGQPQLFVLTAGRPGETRWRRGCRAGSLCGRRRRPILRGLTSLKSARSLGFWCDLPMRRARRWRCSNSVNPASLRTSVARWAREKSCNQSTRQARECRMQNSRK